MAYRTTYPCHIDPRIRGMFFPLTMVYQPSYPYFDPPTHGILTPLPMVF